MDVIVHERNVNPIQARSRTSWQFLCFLLVNSLSVPKDTCPAFFGGRSFPANPPLSPMPLRVTWKFSPQGLNLKGPFHGMPIEVPNFRIGLRTDWAVVPVGCIFLRHPWNILCIILVMSAHLAQFLWMGELITVTSLRKQSRDYCKCGLFLENKFVLV